MEDFIFGTFSSDQLKLAHRRIYQSGIQHLNRIQPSDPQPGEPVTIMVEVGPDMPVDQVICTYTLDGSAPEQAAHAAVLQLEKYHLEWDTIVWGYRTFWRGTIPPQPDGVVVRYRIAGWLDGQKMYEADSPHVKNTLEKIAHAVFQKKPLPEINYRQEGQTFVYHVDTFAPPQWAREAVIYQIFVDRFHPGAGNKWKHPENLRGIYGGTLWGIAENLDYLADLGISAIWLSPFFESPTYHAYDTLDYYQVSARAGGNDALHKLVEAAHARGIRVILDLVCNHLSNKHPYFLDACQDTQSPYRDWFYFDSGEKIGYQTFFGVKTMPRINLENPATLAWMLEIAAYWLTEFDIDGYRLDHANGPGPNFWSDFRAACRVAKPDSFVFGEIVEPPDVLLQYVGRLDGTLDFHLAEVFRQTFARNRWTESLFNRMIQQHQDYFPSDFLLPSFLDNHDMDRFLFIAGNDTEKLKRAAAMQMQLPGPPIIYYGTEVGLRQDSGTARVGGLEASRLPMIWDKDRQDQSLLAYYKQIISERAIRKPWR